jgi:hypothetical protein
VPYRRNARFRTFERKALLHVRVRFDPYSDRCFSWGPQWEGLMESNC